MTTTPQSTQPSNLNHARRVVLNAFAVSNANDLRWDVAFYSVLPTASGGGTSRGAIKNVAWEARKTFKSSCPGFGFVVEVDAQTVAVPATWRIPDGSQVQGHTMKLVLTDEVSARATKHSRLFGRILKEAIKEHFKKQASLKLGPLWQDFNDFCQMPNGLSEHGYHFCRRFQFDAKPLRNGLWVVRFTVGTAALDGRTVADYYETGEVHHLADTILTKLENKPARSPRPVAVRVWHDQRQNGGTSARVYELHEPDRIVQNGRLSIEEQKRLVNLPLPVLNFGNIENLSADASRLVLDSQTTLDDHDETILEPSERGGWAVKLRDVTDGCEVFGRKLCLSAEPVDGKQFRSFSVLPPPVAVRGETGTRILEAPSTHSGDALLDRVRRRVDYIRRFGFYDSRPINPLLACPDFIRDEGAAFIKGILNRLLDDRGINYRFDRHVLYRHVEDIRREVDRNKHDALLAVLREGRNSPPNNNDTHEQIKKKLSIPSQCLHHDTAIPRRWQRHTFDEIMRANRRDAIGIRNRLDLCLGNLLVKSHWFPFVPAAPFHYNVHVGLDVGGRRNSQVMACLGYGFQNPKQGLFFKPAEIPMDSVQAEPVHPEPLYAGLLHLFEETHTDVGGLSEVPSFDRVLFIRDGQLLGAGDDWNEIDALHRLHKEALRRGWIKEQAVWTAVEIMKAAEGWRLLEQNTGFANPTVGYGCAPFDEDNEALLCTTGVPYLSQGTAAPLKIRVINIGGEAKLDEVVRDLVWEADMCFTKPDMGQSLPLTLQIADTGALQLSRSYRISGVTV